MKAFGFLLITAFFALPIQALTLNEMRVAVRQHIDDRTDPKLRYTDTILNTVLNEGQRDLVNRTWCLQKTTSQSISIGTTFYALPTDLIAIQEFNFKETTSAKIRQLEEKSERGLYQENPEYERQRGAPVYYFVRNSTQSATTLEFGVTPVPSTTSAAGTAVIDYYNQPTDLSASADIPLDSQRVLYPYHSALVYYAAWKIKLLEGDTARADVYMKLYEQMVALMIDRLGRIPNYNPSFSAGSGRR